MTVASFDTDKIEKRRRFEYLRTQLENERSTFITHWRDLNDFILPRRGRFNVHDVNKGDKRTRHIVDSTATMASRTLQSGMMGGITSPARPWFNLATAEKGLAEVDSVKKWLHEVAELIRSVYLRSNLYNVLPTTYGDIGTFGTGCLYMEEDVNSFIHFHPFPIGSYMIGNDETGRVRLFVREFRMTVRQVVDKFGKNFEGKEDFTNISEQVKALYKNNTTEAWVDIVHSIIPNPDWDPNRIESKFKKFLSVYYEKGATSGSGTMSFSFSGGVDPTKYLSEKGYDYFPILAPRWEVTAEDVYGTNCPGMVALGDIRQLQLGEKRIMQAVEKMLNPPMVAPTGLKNQKVSLLPGDITYVDDAEGKGGFRAAHEINFDIQSMEGKQQQTRERISRAFFEDLFLMLAQSDRRTITATEIDERKEEKLLALGPVLEQLNQDLLDPLIDNTFIILDNLGLLPEAPEELQNQELKVEYVSIMAQAQKLIGLGSIERFSQYWTQMLQFDPNLKHKVNTLELIDQHAKTVSLNPDIVRSNEDAEELIAQEQEAIAKAQQAEAQAAQIEGAAKAAKNLSDSDPNGENALNAALAQANAGNPLEGL